MMNKNILTTIHHRLIPLREIWLVRILFFILLLFLEFLYITLYPLTLSITLSFWIVDTIHITKRIIPLFILFVVLMGFTIQTFTIILIDITVVNRKGIDGKLSILYWVFEVLKNPKKWDEDFEYNFQKFIKDDEIFTEVK